MEIPRDVPRRHVAGHFGLDRMIDTLQALYVEAIDRRHDPAPPVDFLPIELPPSLAARGAEPALQSGMR